MAAADTANFESLGSFDDTDIAGSASDEEGPTTSAQLAELTKRVDRLSSMVESLVGVMAMAPIPMPSAKQGSPMRSRSRTEMQRPVGVAHTLPFNYSSPSPKGRYNVGHDDDDGPPLSRAELGPSTGSPLGRTRHTRRKA